jgi:hypothetical protein
MIGRLTGTLGKRGGDHAAQALEDRAHALRQGSGGHADHAGIDEHQAAAVDFDDAESRAVQAGIDAEDADARHGGDSATRARRACAIAACGAIQWRKWRVPVNTIARLCSSAAAITSASRMLPPG